MPAGFSEGFLGGVQSGCPELDGRVEVVDVELSDCSAVIPGYTGTVKTAISIPDETFQEAERRADALGVSRSEFFTIAARHYIDELDAQSLTRRIDTVVDLLGDDDSSLAAVDHGRAMMAADTDEW